MGIELANDLAQIVPSKFKDRAKRWWDSLPLEKRTSNSMSWANLLGAIRRNFLTAKWLLDHTQEFEEMRFRQKGHEREEPLNFFQHPRIIHTQPPAWDKEINEIICPDIETLQNMAEHYSGSLPVSWMLTEQIAQVLNVKPNTLQPSNSTCRDCPHYGAFVSYKQADYIQIDWDEEDEAKETQEYLAMHIQSNKNPSAYPLRILRYSTTLVSGQRHSREREKFEGEKASQRERSSKEELYWLIRKLGKSADKQETQDPPADLRCKSKSVSGDGMEEPVIVLHTVARISSSSHVAELPSMTDAEGQTIHQARKAWQLPDGLGSLGARALHVRLHVGSLAHEIIRSRLDSGADITLMSEDFWASIPGLPRPKDGICMTLYHLTGQAKVLGYIKTNIYMETKDGEIISFELEAYVVRNMQVPLLLGEDFQSTYELGVQRWSTGHRGVRVGETRHVIPASSAHSVDLGFQIWQASVAKSRKRLLPEIWRKTYQRSKARK
ncbi:hypothetical protein B0H19DRAFT_969169 [Mycena capillaripes]|nr:hypothetical protein B0H19DRAFT_969169 [Mycena capillaripes]